MTKAPSEKAPSKAAKAAASDKKKCIRVPTKIEDGGSACDGRYSGGESDAFSRYSNDRIRRAALLGLQDEDGTDAEAADVDPRNRIPRQERPGQDRHAGRRIGIREEQANHRVGANDVEQDSPRKTKLSYELHPSVFYAMLMGE